jgi:alpha-mannosidase
MLQHPQYTRTRIEQLVQRFQTRIYRQLIPVPSLQVSAGVGRIPYEQAMTLPRTPAKVGIELGPIWTTFWFRLQYRVPADWQGRVDLLWNSNSEATLWVNGRSIQGLNYSSGQNHEDAPLIAQARGGESGECDVEVACNTSFGNAGGDGVPVERTFRLQRCDLGLFDPEAWDLFHDLHVLSRLEQQQVNGIHKLDPDWGGWLLHELNRFCNEIDEQDRATWGPARKILQALLQHHNGSYAHELSAIGHAHIDTAWLWPLAETHRKCIRTFSTQSAYMDLYPEYKFACSQAYQYEVIRQINPDLDRRIAERVQRGQWIPTGGTWIEPDCNLPSGESLCRQFLFGQRYFQQRFGKRCREFWNPDVFGYNGQLPQIMRLSGIERFLTQKLSWNRFNKPMHHSFLWQGIDGSEVLTHFPPADTYNADCSIPQLRKNVANYKDNDRGKQSYYLFGYGDGGGGPTKTMLETLRRAADLQGLPRCAIRTPDEFFQRLEAERHRLPTMVGELYFEYHRGTYTSQARTKRGNRRCEELLHDVELLSSLAQRLAGAAYPAQAIDDLWKVVLLHQFHDILPGSSIAQVYEDTHRAHDEVLAAGDKLRRQALAALAGAAQDLPVNTLGVPRRELAADPGGALRVIDAPALGVGAVVNTQDQVVARKDGDTIVLENAALRATLHRDGRLMSLVHKDSGREALGEPGNVLLTYDDKPTAYDAWDIDPYALETEKATPPAESCQLTQADPLRAQVVFQRRIGKRSVMTQTVRLDAHAQRLEFHCDVDWQETQVLLKVAFNVAVRAMNASYEMQFGYAERPTHFNDSYALARYEVPGHRWADLSEHGFGVALLSESKYGYATRGSMMTMSLLRSPKAPDPSADLGRHQFAFAVFPHRGDWRQGGVVAQALRFNQPVLWAPVKASPGSLLSVDSPDVIIDTVKKAQDSDALVVRFYECHGARGSATLRTSLPVKQATWCNVLEDDIKPAAVHAGSVKFDFGPHQILTLKLQ